MVRCVLRLFCAILLPVADQGAERSQTRIPVPTIRWFGEMLSEQSDFLHL
jgi:hypothetical protein